MHDEDTGTLSNEDAPPVPRHLGATHAGILVLGMIMSTDVLRTGPAVIANIGARWFLPLWVAGGAVSLLGALCYVEMAASFPDRGGEYGFIRRAWGKRVGVLYAWSRYAIMHTGWIALMAHLAADYADDLFVLGRNGRMAFATVAVILITLLNLTHVRLIFRMQAVLVLMVVGGFVCVVAAGIAAPVAIEAILLPHTISLAGLSSAFVYVFLAYGGWSDGATLSAEVRSSRYGMLIAIVGAIAALCAVCVALNWAMLRGLGAASLARSVAPAAELAGRAFGTTGSILVVAVVMISAVASMNSTIMVGARTTAAAARDVPVLVRLSQWRDERGTPAYAVVAIGALSTILTVVAGFTESGFVTMVDYMTPIYWLFLAAGTGAAIRLRVRYPDQPRPFRTPFFPLFPVVFLLIAIAMFVSSLLSLGMGAIVGGFVMLVGGVLALKFQPRSEPFATKAIERATS